MTEKQYLIWIDILGFDRLAEMIAEKKGLVDRKVRQDFVDTINERIKTIEDRHGIIGKSYGERDDWILVTDSLDSLFRTINDILDHNSGYEDYERIPLEIAAGVGEYDRWAKLEGSGLVIEKPTIDFLKTNILAQYHEWYKQEHNDASPESTFIEFTKSLNNEINQNYRHMSRRIELRHIGSNEKLELITLFIGELGKIVKRARVLEFLDKIKRPSSKLYDRIDELFVEPAEFSEIKRTLAKSRIVFITGTAEYGKTYTAVRLLWEYFELGYEPVWIEGGDEWERSRVRKRLEEIETELEKNRVIYFEDPFGKARYESREGLEREIGVIIDCIRNVEDVYVIITSREEVFKQFEREHLSSTEIKSFERKLNLKRPSYNQQKRTQILLEWAEAKGCKWLNRNVRHIVLSAMMREGMLPTPLSIKDFVVSTIDVVDADELHKKMREKSRETTRSFAAEIESMSHDKKLFLSFPFVSAFPVNEVRAEYEMMVDELHLTECWKFDEILAWFEDDKIAVSKGRMAFSHPSYFEALQHILSIGGRPTPFSENIFSEVLLKLAKRDWASKEVALAIVDNFSLLSDATHELLFKLAEGNEISVRISRAIISDFNMFPMAMTERLLLMFADKGLTLHDTIHILSRNFAAISRSVRYDLLLMLARKGETAWDTAEVIARNFDNLPSDELKRILSLLSERSETSWNVSSILRDNFNMFPDFATDLLLKLAKGTETARGVALALLNNFGLLPAEVCVKLASALIEGSLSSPDVACIMARIVEVNFNLFPEDMRSRLLFKLAQRKEALRDVALTIARNFETVRITERDLLFRLAENDATAPFVATALAENYEKLPNVAEEILFRLASEKTAPHVALAIGRNFDKLPANVRNLLYKLKPQFRRILMGSCSFARDKLEVLDLIWKTRSIMNGECSEIVLSMTKDENEEVRAKAQQLMILLEKGFPPAG